MLEVLRALWVLACVGMLVYLGWTQVELGRLWLACLCWIGAALLGARLWLHLRRRKS